MEGLVLLRLIPSSLAGAPPVRSKSFRRIGGFRVQSSMQSQPIDAEKIEYKPGPLDDLFLAFFRGKMVEEVGWDSEKPGYEGLMEVVNRLMTKGRSNSEIEQSADGKIASMMLARATALSCQWLMGTCSVNSVDLPDGSSCSSGVFVERCKYLEESKCLGVCINTCKLPTQTFFKECMGVPLFMEPNFSDYSCQFKFGICPPTQDTDKVLQEPCLNICPNVQRRRNLRVNADTTQCPKV